MTSRDFCYWLQGYFEINGVEEIKTGQAQIIQKHLSLVFIHEIDPSFGDDNDHLNEVHNSGRPLPLQIPPRPPIQVPTGPNRPRC
jgi:hypothetical protein